MALYFKAGKSEQKRISYKYSRSASFIRIECNGKTVYHKRVSLFQFGKKKKLHNPIEITVGEKEKNKIKITAESLSNSLISTGLGSFKVTAFVDGKKVAEGKV
ncbi:MAG TPA: hypothetical protein ENJ78_01135 [candidate division WWE3 bacterium]|uniref:Uncharacterized protein n=1 Tax=candidate division WWE3 bacterium TaxID=2053526 RepID=A0A7V5J0H6_UNCKA|nr:hypothetical protein [candidate division WWE3 bacterium]